MMGMGSVLGVWYVVVVVMPGQGRMADGRVCVLNLLWSTLDCV